MTATATPTARDEDLEGIVTLPPRAEATTAEEYLGSTDHKVIGRLYIGAAMGFGLLAAVAGLLASIERVSLADYDIFDENIALQIFSLHRIGLLYLLVIPLTIGLATVIVPLQVGAQTLAFPRFAAVGFWTWFIGAVAFILAYLVDGGPGGAEPQSRELWVATLGMIVVGLVISLVALVATVLAGRAPGMGLIDTPFFAWSVLVAAVIWILSLASLLATIVLGFLTTTYGPSLLGQPLLGGAEETWVLVGWFAERPQVISLLVVGLGITSEVVASTAGVAPRARGLLFASIALFGALSLGPWAQTTLYPSQADDAISIVVAFLIGLPLLVLIGGWADTLRRGTMTKAHAATYGSVAFVLLSLGAVITGELMVIQQLDLFGTSAVSAQFAFAVTGALAASIAGLARWAPKIWGRILADRLLSGTALLVMCGGLVVGVVELIGGFLDQPEPGGLLDLEDTRVLVADGLDSTMELLNGLAAGGWAVVGLTLLAVILALALPSTGPGYPVQDDPWGEGQTLEWAVSSPPPADNFAEVPTVDGPTPLLSDEETS